MKFSGKRTASWTNSEEPYGTEGAIPIREKLSGYEQRTMAGLIAVVLFYFWRDLVEELLITNNSEVKKYYNKKVNLMMIESLMVMDVLIEVRNYVHRNYKLLSHPLSGSVKPNETPYKSVLLREGERLDFESLSMIENAISVTEKLYLSKEPKKWDENILRDFRVIDYNLISSGIESMIMKKNKNGGLE